jgi:opacity protein-like surface antigen
MRCWRCLIASGRRRTGGVYKGSALKKLLLASVGLVALTAFDSASAADVAVPAYKAPSPPVADWSGFYLGGHAGYGWGRDPFSDPIFAFKIPGAAPLTGVDSKGFVGGFQAGANWRADAWVGGLEIDLSASDIKGSSSTSAGPVSLGGGTTQSAVATQTDKFDWLGSARARIGFLPWPSMLLYGTGGPAWTRVVKTVDTTAVLSGGGPALTITSSTATPSWRFGWVVGAGAEARLWDSNWLARLEYLHYDFGDSGSQFNNETSGGVATISNMTSGHITTDVIRAGLDYNFGWSPAFVGSARPAYIAMPVKAPRPVAAAWSWSGFYLGGHAGYAWGRDPFSEPFNFNELFSLSGIDTKGFLGGFQAGANWQTGAWVGGLEIDLSAADIKGSTSNSVPITSTPGVTGTDAAARTDKLDMLGSARARLGFLPWPNALLYGTGGLAWTRFVQDEETLQATTSVGVTDTRTTSSSTPNWRFGWVAGVGAEARLWDSNWLARVEYLHYDFGDSGSSFTSNPFISTTISMTSGHLETDVIRAGLSYKFGWNSPVVVGSAGPAAMPVKAPRPVAAVWSWSGFYLGGHAGYGWGRDPFQEPFFDQTYFLLGINSKGFVGGFQAGANWQTGAWVRGLEIDLSATDIKGSTSNGATAPPFAQADTNTDKFDMLGSARARLGYLPWPNALLYGTGGLAWTRLVQSSTELQIILASPADTVVIQSSTPSWRFGWVAGFGAEARLWDSNWLVRAEYLHYDFGNSGGSLSSFAQGGFSFVSSSTTGHLTTDVVRTALSYKFD